MAAPHVAGAAALLRQRHPAWTADQVKSALVQTGIDATADGTGALGPQFQGGGVVALQRADRPLLFARPSLGLVRAAPAGSAPPARASPSRRPGRSRHVAGARGTLAGLDARRPPTAPGDDRRPGSARPRADRPDSGPGRRPGRLSSSSAGERTFGAFRSGAASQRRRSQAQDRDAAAHRAPPRHDRRATGSVSRYRYPETPGGVGVTTTLRGPERVFRFRVTRRVANLGVVITQRGPGVGWSRAIVAGVRREPADRVRGAARQPQPVPGRVPRAASSRRGRSRRRRASTQSSSTAPARPGAGAFTFRYWVNDVTPPTLRLRTPSVRAGSPCASRPSTPAPASIPSRSLAARRRTPGRRDVPRTAWSPSRRGTLDPGTHRLRLRVSDYQESKNTENVARILPNTRWLTATFGVRA